MRSLKLIFFIFLIHNGLFGATLKVGPGKTYSSLQAAASFVQPGDTILMYQGNYSGGDYILNLQGTNSDWITIMAAPGENVVYNGGSQAFQLSDAAYLRIQGLIFEQQTANGVNIDDAGTFDTPAHHIHIENCEWRSMNASGNNDELKLSGLDYFIIKHCVFKNGAAGGSLIDMVGCHYGLFEYNYFENAGSNCIQAKGGSNQIIIRNNQFIVGGDRALNIGGSTDLQYFRPQGATYEASEIFVYANIFEGSLAPIAYVGAVHCEVVNNTIVEPGFWVVRILQETTEPGFQACGQNIFRNNIIVFGNTGKPAYNIGPNTAPETFTISNNLWFNPDNPSWSGPNSPVTETGQILNMDPLFADSLYHLEPTSPAIGKGYNVIDPVLDYFDQTYNTPRSIGAAEYQTSTGVVENDFKPEINVFPNPAHGLLNIKVNSNNNKELKIYNQNGVILWQDISKETTQLKIETWPPGVYFITLDNKTASWFIKN